MQLHKKTQGLLIVNFVYRQAKVCEPVVLLHQGESYDIIKPSVIYFTIQYFPELTDPREQNTEDIDSLLYWRFFQETEEYLAKSPNIHHPHHVPSLYQTLAIMAFQSSLSSVLLMSLMLGDSFLVTELFRLSVYFVPCLPLLLVLQMFPLNICFSSPSALFICPKICSCLFLIVLSGTFCIQLFPLLFRLASFQSMIFSLFF